MRIAHGLKTVQFVACKRKSRGGAEPLHGKKKPALVRSRLLLAVLDLGVLGIDHFALVGLGLALWARRRLLAGSLRVGVNFLAQFLRHLRQGLRLGVDRRLVLGLEHGLGLLDGRLYFFLLACFQLLAVFGERFPDRVHQRLALIARVHQFQRLLVLFGVGLGVFHHFVDFRFVQ